MLDMGGEQITDSRWVACRKWEEEKIEIIWHFWRANNFSTFSLEITLFGSAVDVAVLMGGEVVVCTAASYEPA